MAGRRGGVTVPISTEFNNRGLEQANKQLNAFGKKVTRSFAGIGAAVGGAFALSSITSQLQQMVTAAAQDQKSVVALGQAMSNLGIGSQTAEMEDFVKATMLATGTSDELIRQGLTKLTTATGDAAKAQRLLNLALDISAAGYGDVVAISTALSKAATGNVTALKRLGVPLDENAVKAKDLDGVLASLSSRFRGQASAAANTYAGQLQRLSTAVGEAQETIGYALLGALDDVSRQFGGANGFISGVTGASEQVAYLITGIDKLTVSLIELGDVTGKDGSSWVDWLRQGGQELAQSVIPGYEGFQQTLEGVLAVGKANTLLEEERQRQIGITASRYTEMARAAGKIPGVLSDIAGESDGATIALNKQTTAMERLRAQLDKMSGRRSIARQRIQLQRMLAEGPTATGERTVMRDGKPVTEQYVTKQDRRLFRLDVADARAALGEDIANQPGMGSAAALQQFRLGRKNLRALGLTPAQARRLLPTPDELNPNVTGQQRVVAGQTGQQATTINYNFGDIIVRDAVEAQQQAKRLARLRALSNRGAQAALVGP